MDDRFFRTKLLVGYENFEKIKNSRIAIFGLGGVGSYVAEGLARCGVGNLDLFDGDNVDITNINRQLIADDSTVGLPKVEVMRDRIKKINKDANVEINKVFFNADNENEYDFSKYDYVADVIDTVTCKILLISKAKREKVPIISSMGTGNKLNPCDFEVSDIYSTKECPLARVMRRELRKRGVEELKVVYSREKPKYIPKSDKIGEKRVNSSISFVPPVAGMIIASEVIKDIIKLNRGV